MTENKTINLENTIPEVSAGMRLDQTLAGLYPEYSRERIKNWILAGNCTVDGKKIRPKDKVSGGEKIIIQVTLVPDLSFTPEEIPLSIVFEDDDILIVSKPKNLVVHPAAGNRSGTLLNALLNYSESLNKLPRAGIVHRLDKDTTGLMIVAKTLPAYTGLVNQLQNREIKRVYNAIVHGVMTAGGKVIAYVGRHPRERIKMAVVKVDSGGKEAITHYKVLKKFQSNCLIELNLETGRTHQIRVHMEYIGYPIVGDRLYSNRSKLPKGASEELINCMQNFKRQALHAKELHFIHPITKKELSFVIDLPEDMQELLGLLV